jgi:hypothetical protein
MVPYVLRLQPRSAVTGKRNTAKVSLTPREKKFIAAQKTRTAIADLVIS